MGSLALMSLVVRIATDFPEVSLHGFLATGSIFLRQEVILVLRDLREVTLASLDHRCYGCEALACLQFVTGRLGSAVVGVGLADIDSRTLVALGRRGTVRADEVVTMLVTILLLRFCQGSVDILDTRRISYFSHSRELWLGTTRDYVAHMISRHALALRSEYRFASIPPEKREPL